MSYRIFVLKFHAFLNNGIFRGNFRYVPGFFRLLVNEIKTEMFSDTERYILGEIEDSEDWSSSIEAPFLDYYSG